MIMSSINNCFLFQVNLASMIMFACKDWNSSMERGENTDVLNRNMSTIKYLEISGLLPAIL